MSEPTYYCADCLAAMVPCPWGGSDCPRCDKGHHAGPDYELPFFGGPA